MIGKYLRDLILTSLWDTDDEDFQLQQLLDAESMCGTTLCDANVRIIGGEATVPCKQPWMAQLAYTKG